MQPAWLLETDVFHENLHRLVEEIKHQGMEVQIASRLPFNADKTYLDYFEKNACVVYYGSIAFAAQVQREATWIPGVYYNRNAYDCTYYYPKLASFILNKNYVMIPYGDLLRRQEFLFACLGSEDALFIRPNTGTKLFTGCLVYKETFARDVADLDCYGIQHYDLCVIASPFNILDEWRFVVVGDKVITGSQYKLDNKLNVAPTYPPEALALAEKVVATEFQPNLVWCLDICRTKANNYHLLEIGSFSCSGLYACDLAIIVKEVSKIALDEWKDYNEC